MANSYGTSAEFAALDVAAVHDWLTVYGCAERVLQQILQIFPGADVFTVVDFMGDEDRAFLIIVRFVLPLFSRYQELKQHIVIILH